MSRLKLVAVLGALAALVACATTPAPTEPDFSGTWTGLLPVGPTDTRAFTVQVHERDDLSLMAYVMGGTSKRTVPAGARIGDQMLLSFEFTDAGLARSILLEGAVTGDALTGTASDGAIALPVAWTRIAGPVTERKFAFVGSAGSGEDLTELAVALDDTGALVSGSFVGGGCDLIACGGGVLAFSEDPAGNLAIDLETGGSCSGTGTITATFDAATKFYNGAWTYTDDGACGGGVAAGALMGGRDMGTTSGDAAQVLAALGDLADDLEAGAAFAAPYAPVWASYLHFGETEPQLLASLNAEVAAHPGAGVDFGDFKALRTVVPADVNPYLSSTPMASFRDVRADGSGTYRDVAAETPGEGGLNHIIDDAGQWRLSGNQVGEFDLPFDYTVGTQGLDAPSGAGMVTVKLGGWGAHFGPLTGHLEGNGKADLMAHYAADVSELVEINAAPGGTPGVCDIDLVWSGAGEVCGYPGGPGGALIRDRILRYVAPYDGEVLEIVYEERPRPLAAPETHYFDNVPHWSVRVAFEGGITIRFVHLGQIIGPVRAGLIAATGIDPDTYVPSAVMGAPDYCPPSPDRCFVDVLGGATFSIAAGDEIAKVQTDAALITGYPGFADYYRGQIGPSISPWGQMEFFVNQEAATATGASVCVFQYLPDAKQTALAAAMTADMLNPNSLRYAETGFVRPWKFRAEAELCNNDGYFHRNENDFSSIHAQLGGWYERPEAGTTADEQFTIAKIHQGAGAYDPTLYDVKLGASDPTEYLIGRIRVDGTPFTWTLPGVGPTPVFYPTGEALELTASTFVVKWREIGPAPGVSLYQRAAYEIDPTTGLKIKWGNLAGALGAAVAPVLAPGEACNDADVLCYGHTRP